MENLKDFTGGWFIGDFEPSVYKTSLFEIAVKEYNKGDKEKRHVHKLADEWTIILEGTIKMNNILYKDGDIVQIKKGVSTDFKSLTNSKTLVIKSPSIPNDKYIINE